jgi:hypothetical protein
MNVIATVASMRAMVAGCARGEVWGVGRPAAGAAVGVAKEEPLERAESS